MKNPVVTSYKYSFKIVYEVTTTNPVCNHGDDKISDIYYNLYIYIFNTRGNIACK